MKHLRLMSLLAIFISVFAIGLKLYLFNKNDSYNFQENANSEKTTYPVTGQKDATNEFEKTTSHGLSSYEDQNGSVATFWAKIIFSGIFCLAALFVILSKKYVDETKKWAFSVLTLIAGVWIGSISN